MDVAEVDVVVNLIVVYVSTFREDFYIITYYPWPPPSEFFLRKKSTIDPRRIIVARLRVTASTVDSKRISLLLTCLPDTDCSPSVVNSKASEHVSSGRSYQSTG